MQWLFDGAHNRESASDVAYWATEEFGKMRATKRVLIFSQQLGGKHVGMLTSICEALLLLADSRSLSSPLFDLVKFVVYTASYLVNKTNQGQGANPLTVIQISPTCYIFGT